MLLEQVVMFGKFAMPFEESNDLEDSTVLKTRNCLERRGFSRHVAINKHAGFSP
jgi:hypothetical protein